MRHKDRNHSPNVIQPVCGEGRIGTPGCLTLWGLSSCSDSNSRSSGQLRCPAGLLAPSSVSALQPWVPATLASSVPGPVELFPVPETWNMLDLLLTVLFPKAPGTAGLHPSLPQPSGRVLLCGFPRGPWH